MTNEGTRKWGSLNREHSNIQGLPKLLRQQGYATAFFTPTPLGAFNENEVIEALGFEKVVSKPDFDYLGESMVNYFGPADEVMTQPILKWVGEQSDQKKPFALGIITNVGHHKYETPTSWPKVRFDGVTDPAYQSYLNCLRYIDHFLEELMAGFDQLGVTKDTIFVIVGDHGSPFGEHGVRLMNSVYQESMHVLSIVYAPGLVPGNIHVTGPRQQIDILPTITELLGYQTLECALPGVSLLTPANPSRDLYLTGSMEGSSLALRRGMRKYIYEFGRSPTLVFDLVNDPKEANPLSGVDVSEIKKAEQDMAYWQAAVRSSMFAQPPERSDSSGKWQISDAPTTQGSSSSVSFQRA